MGKTGVKISGCGAMLFVLALTTGQRATQAEDASETRDSKESVNGQLKTAVTDALPRLGALEDWQKRIFEEEVIPQYQRFIRDYRASASGMSAEVDIDGIRRYLQFHAAKTLKQKDNRFYVYIKADPECSKCVLSLAEVQRLVKLRIERRGMVPVWIQDSQMGDGSRTPQQIEERMADLGIQKSGAGYATVQLFTAAADALDTAHADERHYALQTAFVVRDLAKNQGHVELLENDRFESAALRLLTDACADIGARAEVAQLHQATSDRDELMVEINGIQDYSQYSHVRVQLETGLKDVSSIEERKSSRGQTVFSVRTKKSAQEIQRQIASLPLVPAQTVGLTGSGPAPTQSPVPLVAPLQVRVVSPQGGSP